MRSHVPGTASPWAGFLSKIDVAVQQISPGNDPYVWFRGQTSSTYPLLPSLFRFFTYPNGKEWEKVWNLESDLYWEFSARARELHNDIQNDWDILFAMQHYGTPTRLLDWTEVLGVAIYFAVLGVDESIRRGADGSPIAPPCVYVLNPYALNQSTGWGDDLVYPPNLGWDPDEEVYYSYGELLGEPGIDWDWPAAIYPRHRTARIHAQTGWFTIHGDEYVPFDNLRHKKRFLRRIELPFDAIAEARQFLDRAGINRYLLFPDLANLSIHLRDKNRMIIPAKPNAKQKDPKAGRKKRRAG